MEAYARGVNRFIEQHRDELPIEFSLLKYKPQPWHAGRFAGDLRLHVRNPDRHLGRRNRRAKVTEKVGCGARARALFSRRGDGSLSSSATRTSINDGSQRSHLDPDDEDDDDDDMEPDGVLKAAMSGARHE